MPVRTSEEKLFIYALKNTWPAIRYNRKKYLFLLFLLLFMGLGIVVYAAERTPKEKPDDWKESPGLFNMVTFSMIEDIFTGDDTAAAAEQVRVNYDETGTSISIGGKRIENLGTIIGAVNDMCKGLALLFLIITFLIGLLAIRQREQMEDELLRRFIMFILGMVCIFSAMGWCFTIANIGSEMAGRIADTGSGIQNATNEGIVSDIESMIWDGTHIANYDHGDDGFTGGFDWLETHMENLGMSVSFMAELIVPWLLLKSARIIVSVIIWGRAIEVMIISAFSPLGFAEIPDSHNPVSGTGLNFIKNMVALSISGAIIVFAMFVSNQILLSLFSGIAFGTDSTFKDITEAIFGMVAVSFARVALVTRSQHIAKSVVGII